MERSDQGHTIFLASLDTITSQGPSYMWTGRKYPAQGEAAVAGSPTLRGVVLTTVCRSVTHKIRLMLCRRINWVRRSALFVPVGERHYFIIDERQTRSVSRPCSRSPRRERWILRRMYNPPQNPGCKRPDRRKLPMGGTNRAGNGRGLGRGAPGAEFPWNGVCVLHLLAVCHRFSGNHLLTEQRPQEQVLIPASVSSLPSKSMIYNLNLITAPSLSAYIQI